MMCVYVFGSGACVCCVPVLHRDNNMLHHTISLVDSAWVMAPAWVKCGLSLASVSKHKSDGLMAVVNQSINPWRASTIHSAAGHKESFFYGNENIKVKILWQ